MDPLMPFAFGSGSGLIVVGGGVKEKRRLFRVC
jgi:hypothetical protein